MIKEVQIQAVKALNTVYLSSPSPHFPFSIVPSIHRPLFFKRLSPLTTCTWILGSSPASMKSKAKQNKTE